MNSTLPDRYVQLIIICACFLLINTLVISFFSIEISRLAGVSTSFLIFLFFLYHKGYLQVLIFLVFVLFILRDSLLLDYEHPFNKTLSFCTTIIAYAFLAAILIRRLKVFTLTPLVIIFIVSLIMLNILNVYFLYDLIVTYLDNSIQLVLFFVQSAVLILLGFLGFIYNGRFEGSSPIIYLYMIVSFIISDLCGLAAYFFKVDIAYFPERAFYVIGLIMLAYFSFNVNFQKSEKILEREKRYLF